MSNLLEKPLAPWDPKLKERRVRLYSRIKIIPLQWEANLILPS